MNPVRNLLPLILAACVAGAAEPAVPPSPSTHPGKRILPLPHFTHWPAVAYGDERRNAAFTIPYANPAVDAKGFRPVTYEEPVPRCGAPGTVGWEGGEQLPIRLPEDGEGISGLIDLSLEPGARQALLTLDNPAKAPEGRGWSALPGDPPKLVLRLGVRVVDAREDWPLARLQDGYPVDAAGLPVVLLDQRRNADRERKLALLRRDPPRGEGRALVVGDPLEALGRTAWEGLDAECRPAQDDRHPQHAVLVALAQAINRTPAGGAALDPRTIVWCPGNQVLAGGAWDAEEERLLGVVRTRCEALGFRPRLVLALPPLPVDGREHAQERRELLRRSANQLGWVVLDLARAAGEPEDANQVGEQVFTTNPNGTAQERMRAALAGELDK
ncbi:MAG: hypothetical protein L6R48_05825 [Planctomycetes bacterium]|nr:hypothetical protein [Planctomycetota bacterium]